MILENNKNSAKMVFGQTTFVQMASYSTCDMQSTGIPNSSSGHAHAEISPFCIEIFP